MAKRPKICIFCNAANSQANRNENISLFAAFPLAKPSFGSTSDFGLSIGDSLKEFRVKLKGNERIIPKPVKSSSNRVKLEPLLHKRKQPA
jgi:hypothetical protein